MLAVGCCRTRCQSQVRRRVLQKEEQMPTLNINGKVHDVVV